jgi:hypothetical protein
MPGYNNPYGQSYWGGYPMVSTTPATIPVQQASASPQSNDIIWVQGEVGARAYPVPAGRMAVLMDSEDSCFYIKAVDAYGMPQPLRKFRFQEETSNQKALPQASQAAMPTQDYITREEFEKRLSERLDELTK